MKPPQSLPLQMAEHLLRALPDSVANHVTARSIGDWRALAWLAAATGWTRRKRSAICSGKQCPHDSIRCEQEGQHLEYLCVSLCAECNNNNNNNIRLIRPRQSAQPYIRYTVQHTIVCHAVQQCNGTHTVTQDSNNQVILGLAHRM